MPSTIAACIVAASHVVEPFQTAVQPFACSCGDSPASTVEGCANSILLSIPEDKEWARVCCLEQVLLLGGVEDDDQLADAWLLDLAKSTWSCLPATALPFARSWHSAQMLQREQVLLHVPREAHLLLVISACCMCNCSAPSSCPRAPSILCSSSLVMQDSSDKLFTDPATMLLLICCSILCLHA